MGIGGNGGADGRAHAAMSGRGGKWAIDTWAGKERVGLSRWVRSGLTGSTR
jgi:hypothetical protein